MWTTLLKIITKRRLWCSGIFFLLSIAGCNPRNAATPTPNYSTIYDSLSNEVVYMDSLMEASNLLLLESHLQQLVAEEASWSPLMDVHENTWMSFWIAYFYNRLGNLPEAKRYSDLAMDNLDRLRDTAVIMAVINNTAGIEAEMGNFDRSIELLVRGMEVFKDDTTNVELIDFYNNIGHNYNITGDHDLAVRYFARHRALAAQLGIEEEYGVYHFNMGDMYYNRGHYEKSIGHMKQAMDYFHRFDRVEDELHVNAMLASNYTALNRLDSAEHLLEGNLQQAERLQLWEVYIETAISLFELHLARGNEAGAIAAVEQGLSRVHVTNTARMQLKIYDRLITYYANKGDFRQAFVHTTRQKAVRDSVFNADKNSFMREMAVKYETDQKNNQIGQLQQVNERERRIKTAYLIGLILLVCVVFIIVVLIRRVSKQKEALEEVNATKDRLFSIIAHDLRSPMIALQGMGKLMDHYVIKKDEQKLRELGSQTGQTLERINHLLDNLLNWAVTNSNQITYQPTAQDLEALLQEALTLHQPAAAAKEVQLRTELQPERVFVDLNMIATVLRNLISNAVKYAPSGSVVSIAGAVDTQFYQVSIRDEGGGIPQDVLDRLAQSDDGLVVGREKGSFGLGLRLATYFARRNRGKLIIKNDEKGVLAVLHLPLAI